MAEYLKELIDKRVSIITADGKSIVGTLRGFDQVTNLVVEDCHERVYSEDAPMQIIELGLYIIKGPNVVVIGELDKAADEALDHTKLRGTPLGPLVY